MDDAADRELRRATRWVASTGSRSGACIAYNASLLKTVPDESTRALAMNQLAGVLSDLELVTWPKRGIGWRWLPLKRSELERLKKEETQPSVTDLTEVRKKWFEEKGLDATKAARQHRDRPIRNHGLFSKAERALEIAGWGEKARDDIEIFRLVDAEGLTPLLMILNEPEPAKAGKAPAPRQVQTVT